MIEILNLATEINQIAEDQGFWLTPNLGEKVMLVIVHLSKAVEAYQRNKRADLVKFRDLWPYDKLPTVPSNTNAFTEQFQLYIHNSVEDKLAAAVMRTLDYVHHRKFDLAQHAIRDGFAVSNFAEACLYITSTICHAYQSTVETEFLWGWVLVKLESLCRYHNINLEEVIRWKLVYNAASGSLLRRRMY